MCPCACMCCVCVCARVCVFLCESRGTSMAFLPHPGHPLGCLRLGGCCSHVPLLVRSADAAALPGPSTSPSLSISGKHKTAGEGGARNHQRDKASPSQGYLPRLCVLGVSSSQLTLSALCAQKAQDTTGHMNGETENHLSVTRQVVDTKVKYFAHALKTPENDSPFTVLGTGAVFQREVVNQLEPRPRVLSHLTPSVGQGLCKLSGETVDQDLIEMYDQGHSCQGPVQVNTHSRSVYREPGPALGVSYPEINVTRATPEEMLQSHPPGGRLVSSLGLVQDNARGAGAQPRL
uniref:Uncharacterized protein n=1 Tax=Molossus molossus TaxID=27622 RepID=A0A7J8BM09_MOLMO|nr:hypothetical protein HJG59_010172 [Molossus molossus]